MKLDRHHSSPAGAPKAWNNSFPIAAIAMSMAMYEFRKYGTIGRGYDTLV